MDGDKIKGLAAGLAATVLWGGFYPVGRWLFNSGAGEPDGFTASAIRFLIAALALSPALANREAMELLRREWRRDIPFMILLAAVGIVGEGVLVLISTKYTTAARASLMANSAPIFTAVFSYFITREALTGRKIAGMLAGAAGIGVMFVMRGGDSFSGGTTFIGDLLAVISGILWALYTVLGTAPVARYGAFFCTEWLFIFGTLMAIPIAVVWGAPSAVTTYSAASWLGLAYLGLLSAALGFALWYVALKHLKPGELGAFGYLTPVISAALARVFFAERLGWGFMLALVLILGGVALMMERAPRAAGR